MARQRRSYTAAFEAQVALAAPKGDRTANELAAQHQIRPTPVSDCKQALLQGASPSAEGGEPAKADDEPDATELFGQVDVLVERPWRSVTYGDAYL